MAGIVSAIGLGIAAIGTAASIAQAAAAKKKQREADRAAEEALNEAKKKLSVNRLEGIQVPLSAYNEAFKSGLAQQQQALTALAESDPRALAAGVGKVQAIGISQDEKTRQDMEKALYDRDIAVAQNQQQIDLNMAEVGLSEVKGAQAASLQAEQQAVAGITDAIQSAAGGVQNYYENTALYKKNKDAAKTFQREGQIDISPLSSAISNNITSLNNNIGANGLLGANNLLNTKLPPVQLRPMQTGFALQPMQTGLIKFD
jgi:hypothetical protein